MTAYDDSDEKNHPAPPPSDMGAATYAVDAVFRLAHVLTRIGNMRLTPWDLSLSSYVALRIMAGIPHLSLAQLSRRCFVRPQTIHRIVLQLEAQGFVVRGPHEDSKRAVALSVTPKGLATLELMSAEVAKTNATLRQALTVDDLTLINERLRSSALLVEADLKKLEALAAEPGRTLDE